MKWLTGAVVALGMSVFGATLAVAATIPPTQFESFSGNDSNPTGQTDLNNWITSLDIYEPGFGLFEVAKVDAPATMAGDMSVSYDGDPADSKSGSWSWAGSDAINFAVYKAGNGFVAHYYEPGIFGNMWDTGDLGLVNNGGRIAGISHITLYGVDGSLKNPGPGPMTPVPLPAAGWMLIAGLGGLGMMRRMKTRS